MSRSTLHDTHSIYARLFSQTVTLFLQSVLRRPKAHHRALFHINHAVVFYAILLTDQTYRWPHRVTFPQTVDENNTTMSVCRQKWSA